MYDKQLHSLNTVKIQYQAAEYETWNILISVKISRYSGKEVKALLFLCLFIVKYYKIELYLFMHQILKYNAHIYVFIWWEKVESPFYINALEPFKGDQRL